MTARDGTSYRSAYAAELRSIDQEASVTCGEVEGAQEPWIVPASEIDVAIRRCHCCDRPLKRKARYLELNTHTGTYCDDGSVPPNLSQGWFPFGLTCAKRLLSEGRKVRLVSGGA